MRAMYTRPNRPLGLTRIAIRSSYSPPPVGTHPRCMMAWQVLFASSRADSLWSRYTGVNGAAGVGDVDGLTEIAWQAVIQWLNPRPEARLVLVPTEEGTELPAHREQEPDRAGLPGESAGYHGEDDGKVLRSGAGGAEGPHVLGPKVAGELVDPARLVGMGPGGNFHGRCHLSWAGRRPPLPLHACLYISKLARYTDTYVGGTGELGHAVGAARTPRDKLGGGRPAGAG